MIYTISKPEKITWIYKLIKKFCKKAGVNYGAAGLAQWLRINILNPVMNVKVYKKTDDSEIQGFAVYYITTRLLTPILYVQNILAETKEAKGELVSEIVTFAIENCVEIIQCTTHRDPKLFTDAFNIGHGEFKITSFNLEGKLEV